MPKSNDTSKSTRPTPKGRILTTTYSVDGHSTLALDNGPFRQVRILCRTETLADLLSVEGADLVDHVTTRKPGHFRVKRANR